MAEAQGRGTIHQLLRPRVRGLIAIPKGFPADFFFLVPCWRHTEANSCIGMPWAKQMQTQRSRRNKRSRERLMHS